MDLEITVRTMGNQCGCCNFSMDPGIETWIFSFQGESRDSNVDPRFPLKILGSSMDSECLVSVLGLQYGSWDFIAHTGIPVWMLGF